MYVHGGSSSSGVLTGTWALDLSGAPRTGTASPSRRRRPRSRRSRGTRAADACSATDPIPGRSSSSTAPAARPRGSRSRPRRSFAALVRRFPARRCAAYDALHDQLFVPYAGFARADVRPSMTYPWTIALDPIVAPGRPRTCRPSGSASTAWHGLMYMRWSLSSSGGLLYELPGLEREISANVFPVGQPFASGSRFGDRAVALSRTSRCLDGAGRCAGTTRSRPCGDELGYDWTRPGRSR